MNSQIGIGSIVAKRSRKPFQNGEKTAVVVGFGVMIIPIAKGQTAKYPTKVVESVFLYGCEGPVQVSALECVR